MMELVNNKAMKDQVLFKVKSAGYKKVFCFANESYCKHLNDALKESKLEKSG